MTVLRRVPVIWTTGVGGAGVSVFYSLSSTDATAALGTFFDAIKTKFNVAVTWNIPGSGDTIESSTGELVGSWAGGTSAALGGTVSTAYVAGTGAWVNWGTGSVRNGRRFRGRTFLCPLINTSFDTTGTLTNTDLSVFQAAANTLAATNLLTIWGRPTTPGGTDGFISTVLSAAVPDKVTSLRSRRS